MEEATLEKDVRILAPLFIWAKQLRIHHWIKNSLVFTPLLFSGKLTHPAAVSREFLCFFSFCMLASSIYILNDVIDLEKDKLHPKKKYRPLAAGLISKPAAVIAALCLALSSLACALNMNKALFTILSVYGLNNLLYSYYLKQKVIADVLSVSTGFMLRFLAGAFVIAAEPSRWFYVCGFSLSLFLAFGKRRTEIELISDKVRGAAIRATLDTYSKEKLDAALSAVSALCILTYILFVTDPETLRQHQSNRFIYTVPIVVYCLFRYMFKVQEGEGTGPVDIIFSDKAFIISILLWLLTVLLILY